MPTCDSSARTDAATEFAVSASVSPDPMIIGDTAIYHVVVTNTGTVDAADATTTMTITPDNAVTFGTLPAGCTASGQVVTCPDATLAAGVGDLRHPGHGQLEPFGRDQPPVRGDHDGPGGRHRLQFG
jgi:uncharacterized repeat protein (TIGR01451 family)